MLGEEEQVFAPRIRRQAQGRRAPAFVPHVLQRTFTTPCCTLTEIGTPFFPLIEADWIVIGEVPTAFALKANRAMTPLSPPDAPCLKFSVTVPGATPGVTV